MKRMILVSCLLVCAVPFTARADHEIDWNDWYEGEVQVRLRADRGEGGLYERGRPVRLKLETNEDAYHLVYAIDTDGSVRLLFPRAWEDDGWLFAHEELHLDAHHLAWPADRWGTGGIVYVEAVASPVPFDFTAMGVVFRSGHAGWVRQGRPFRVQGDPFLAFNEVHQILFPDWEQAVFAVDYTYFYVDHVREAPRYLGYTYQRVYVPPPAPVFSVGLRFVWHWEFGRRYCRPVYPRYYHPGRHVVHHRVHRHHHVVYRSPAPRHFPRRPASIPWVAPERRRLAHDPPVVRQRQRPTVEPRRERVRPAAEPRRQGDRKDLPRVERSRSARFVADAARRSVERKQDTPARRTAEPPGVRRETTPRRSEVPAVKRSPRTKSPASKEVQRREAKPEQKAAQVERKSKERRSSKAKPKRERAEAREKQGKRR